ncbi:hypothetical protein MHU86_6069 [Fragilaria crotonensis]|nr:hypothetical protein MHU86_6069 [Fragilaria crotonensis]
MWLLVRTSDTRLQHLHGSPIILRKCTTTRRVARYLRMTKIGVALLAKHVSGNTSAWRLQILTPDPTLLTSRNRIPRSNLLGTSTPRMQRTLSRAGQLLGLFLCSVEVPWPTSPKIQSTVSTSSTEAEFLAAVHAAKIAKYLRSILSELGYPQPGPTTLFEDNAAAILMVNASRPTPRARHIDIQHFALQEWKAANEIVLSHIPGVVNSADSLTKSLGSMLHHRHVRRLMGHYGAPWSPPAP